MEGRIVIVDELLAILHLGESIAVSVLVWRAIVADRERREILTAMYDTEQWIRGLVKELLETRKKID